MNCKSILKKKIPLNFIATSTQKQLHEIKLRKKKKWNKFLQMQSKKKSKKKWHTTKHTLSFYCEKKAWLCAVYTLIMIFLIIECAILKCNPKYSPLGKNESIIKKISRQCQICITLFLIFDFTVITNTNHT